MQLSLIMWNSNGKDSSLLLNLMKVQTPRPRRTVWIKDFGSVNTDIVDSIVGRDKKTIISINYNSFTLYKDHVVECKTLLLKKKIGSDHVPKIAFSTRCGILRSGPKDEKGNIMTITACSRSILNKINRSIAKSSEKKISNATISGLSFFGFKSEKVIKTNVHLHLCLCLLLN